MINLIFILSVYFYILLHLQLINVNLSHCFSNFLVHLIMFSRFIKTESRTWNSFTFKDYHILLQKISH